MANDYYGRSALTEHTLARASQISAQLLAIEVGFDRLPGKAALAEGRVTYVVDSGAADAYVVALSPAITAYVAGLHLSVLISNANTGACTVDVDGLGARSIKRTDGTDPAAGDLPAAGLADLRYDGTNFIIMSATAADVTAAAASAAAAAASYDSFDDRYLGAKASAPTLDNDANALLTGALYWNSTTSAMYAWNGTAWRNFSTAYDPVAVAITGGSVSGVTDLLQSFKTTTEAAAATIFVDYQRIIVLTPRAFYRRETTEPGHSFKFRSTDRFMPDGSSDGANGGWWGLDQDFITSDIAGMKGDGLSGSAAGNTTGMTNAIAFLADRGGGKLLVGAGRHKLTAATVITASGIEIIGQNRQVTILDYTDATATNGVEIVGDLSYWRLEGFQVQNADNHGFYISDSGADNPSRGELSEVSAKFNGGDGFYFSDAFLVGLFGLHSQANTGWGINFTGYHTTINAEHCQANLNGLGGWRVFDCVYSRFDACAADQNTGDGWHIEQTIASFEGCGAEANARSGFNVVGSAGTITTGVRASLTGCFGFNNDSGGTGGNFLNVTASDALVVLGLRECVDKTAPGGRSVNIIGSLALTFLEGCAWVGTKSLAGDYVENATGDLTLAKSTPLLQLIDGADTAKFLVSGGEAYLQAPSGKLRISAISGADLTTFKARIAGAYVDILHAANGVAKAGDTMTGDLTISKTTPLFQLTDGADTAKFILFGGIAYIQAPTAAGSLHISAISSGDLTQLKAKFAGVFHDIQTTHRAKAGTATIADTASTQAVTFANAAADANYAVALATDGDERVWVSAKTAAGFTLNRTGTSGARSVDWAATAIGS